MEGRLDTSATTPQRSSLRSVRAKHHPTSSSEAWLLASCNGHRTPNQHLRDGKLSRSSPAVSGSNICPSTLPMASGEGLCAGGRSHGSMNSRTSSHGCTKIWRYPTCVGYLPSGHSCQEEKHDQSVKPL